MDVFDSLKRSDVMSRIRSKDTKPEICIRKLLFAEGFRYRIHSRRLPGCPDLVLPKYRTAVFVHGCFWHSHSGCKRSTTPSTRVDYWNEKLRRNQERDLIVKEELLRAGWRVLVVWECACRKKFSTRLQEMMSVFIRDKQGNFMEIGQGNFEN